jgi:hypothetical protein
VVSFESMLARLPTPAEKKLPNMYPPAIDLIHVHIRGISSLSACCRKREKGVFVQEKRRGRAHVRVQTITSTLKCPSDSPKRSFQHLQAGGFLVPLETVQPAPLLLLLAPVAHRQQPHPFLQLCSCRFRLATLLDLLLHRLHTQTLRFLRLT